MVARILDRDSAVLGTNATSLLISLTFCLLIVNCIFIDKGYFDSLPQDLFGDFDGIYRTSLGQIPHRDFSTADGVLQLLLPSYFMSLGYDSLTSIRYYHVLVLLMALCIVLYAQCTRLDSIVSLFFGALVALALACKENFGDSPFLVTEGMFYNRVGVVFLTLQLVLFIPFRDRANIFNIIDGAAIGIICSILFYIKITFGLVGIGFIVLRLLSDNYGWRQKARSLAASVAMFLLISIVIEFAYGLHLGWIRDVRMAILSSSSSEVSSLRRFPSKLVVNTPEIVVCIIIPLIVMKLSGLRIRLYWIIYAAALAFSSVLLVVYSAQTTVLFLPLAFLFFALSKLSEEREGQSGAVRTYAFAVKLVSLFAIASIGYPMLINIAYASWGYSHGLRLQSENGLLSSIRTKEPSGGETSNVLSTSSVNLIESIPTLEMFMLARSSKLRGLWDNLSFPEYGFYLNEGLKAVKAGCRNEARIATFDFVNPFPVLLGWPEGGGMIFTEPGYLVSKDYHLSENELFRGIDCVLIPKMPLKRGTKQFLLDIYGHFVQENYKKTFESDLWTVMDLL
jgi:hypothetical protein